MLKRKNLKYERRRRQLEVYELQPEAIDTILRHTTNFLGRDTAAAKVLEETLSELALDPLTTSDLALAKIREAYNKEGVEI